MKSMKTAKHILTFLLITCPISNAKGESSEGAEYGVDVSFPMHYSGVSTNYPWLPHNADPENNPVPDEYKNMPIQPLSNMQKAYDELIEGCVKHYGAQGQACRSVERDRIEMSLLQPQRYGLFSNE